MRIRLLEITHNPIELIYKSYRICYSKLAYDSIELPTYKEQIKFIKSCIAKGHFSPLEHVSFTFLIEDISRACSHQLVRHRTFKFNQQSQRYVDGENFQFVIPDVVYDFGLENQFLDFIKPIQESYKTLQTELTCKLKERYPGVPERLLKQMANENARSLLPNATTTQLIMTCDLHNFRNFINLRECVHAQDEIQEVAVSCRKLVSKYIPFVDYLARNCGRTCFECGYKTPKNGSN